MSNEVRVRFAPSPTGYLHVGGARTALFNYLFAKNMGGKFLLRIEDTDQSRFQENALDEIFTSMKWLGLDWDEGPEKEGDCGPYHQSKRLDKYKKAVDELLEKGEAYRCFCTSQRLTEVREAQEKAKASKTGYDRHCRDLSDAEIAEKLDANTPYVIRLKVPLEGSVKFIDMIRGEIEYQCENLDDLVLMKTDGFPTYHLANVVDDHDMRISHVLRGDEWIASTPKHVLLYRAFEWELPKFAHLPVILSATGGKLSKRKGAASVMDYKNAGYLPEALFNFLTLLGWNPGDDREKMELSEIIEAFGIDRISPKSAVFDETKLEWMNGLYMAEESTDTLFKEVAPLWKEAGITETDSYLKKVIDLMKSRSKKITDLVEGTGYFFSDPAEYDPKGVKKRWKSDVDKVLSDLADEMDNISEFTQKNIEAVFQAYIDKTEISGGKLIHPTRLAVSGVTFGAGLFEMLELIGKDAVVRRMRAAVKWIEENKK